MEMCELKLNILSQNLIFVQIIAIWECLEMEPFATFKWPFAICGEWRMGWTTLTQMVNVITNECSPSEVPKGSIKGTIKT